MNFCKLSEHFFGIIWCILQVTKQDDENAHLFNMSMVSPKSLKRKTMSQVISRYAHLNAKFSTSKNFFLRA